MKSLVERFDSKVEHRGPNDCWPWIGHCAPSGHGQFWIGDRLYGPHRVAYELTHDLPVGSLRPDQFVCHACDNPPCVNPAHLWLGTQADNMRDAAVKGRARSNPRWVDGRCKNGHDVTDPKNVYRVKGTRQRQCRTCNRERMAARAQTKARTKP